MCNCEDCKSKKASTPCVVSELSSVMMERQVKRIWVALVVAIAAIVMTNVGWLIASCQYDYTSEEIVTIDGTDGIANYIGNDGDIVNGEDHNSKAEKENP